MPLDEKKFKKRQYIPVPEDQPAKKITPTARGRGYQTPIVNPPAPATPVMPAARRNANPSLKKKRYA